MSIHALDHVAVGVADPATARIDYAALLGQMPSGDRFRLGNTALDFVTAAPGLAGIAL